MKTVRDGEGTRYLLLKRSETSSLVRNPMTGEERYVANSDIQPIDGESPLETAASSVPEAVRHVLSAVHGVRALGLLVELVDRGRVPVRDLLDASDLCESDLHAHLVEFQYAGLIVACDGPGERGYAPTETARKGVAILRGERRAGRSRE